MDDSEFGCVIDDLIAERRKHLNVTPQQMIQLRHLEQICTSPLLGFNASAWLDGCQRILQREFELGDQVVLHLMLQGEDLATDRG